MKRDAATTFRRPAGRPPLDANLPHDARCEICNRSYAYDRRKGHTRRRCNSCRSNCSGFGNREALKRRMVAYKGGKCEACGYDMCVRALTFHHVNGADKRFTFAGNHNRSWSVLRDELDKCVMLCQNCHNELHAGMLLLISASARVFHRSTRK
jgi:hypothetical protein